MNDTSKTAKIIKKKISLNSFQLYYCRFIIFYFIVATRERPWKCIKPKYGNYTPWAIKTWHFTCVHIFANY